MLLCGDFRQILPVIQGGTRGNIVDLCLKKSFLWDQVAVKHLHTNMRVLMKQQVSLLVSYWPLEMASMP